MASITKQLTKLRIQDWAGTEVSHQKIELADKCAKMIKIKDKKLYEVENL